MADLLIFARQDDAPGRYRPDDIVGVYEDGHQFSPQEGPPTFRRASLPGVPVDQVRHILTLQQQIDAAVMAPAAVRAIPSLLRRYAAGREPEQIARRRYRVPDGLTTLALNQIKDKNHAT